MKIKFEYRIVKEAYIKPDEMGVDDVVEEYHLRKVLFKDNKPSKIIEDELFIYSDAYSETDAIEDIEKTIQGFSSAFNKPVLDRQELQL